MGSVRSRGPVLHYSVLLKCGNRAASLFQRFPDKFFAASFFQRFAEYFSRSLNRDHTNPIDVSKEKITRPDADSADLDGDAKVHYFVTRRGVLRIRSPAERRKIQLEDSLGVAQIAIQHGSCCTKLAGADAHQFAPERVARRGTGVDVDFVGLETVVSPKNKSEWLLHEPVFM